MLATQSELAPLDKLTQTPYVRVLTYPKISLAKAKSRVRQLERLGVDALVFRGRTRVGRLGVLGIGTVGLVVQCSAGGRSLAVKIRRTDANRPSLDEEYRITALVNHLGVGVELFGHTRDMILMRSLDIVELPDWFKGLAGPGARARARDMLHSILNQCRTLDIMGIDHGELSDLRKHVVVADGIPWILDFESASTGRRPRNVTSAAQYLLVGGRVAPLVRRKIGLKDTKQALGLLGSYKRELSDFDYAKLLEGLRIA